MQYKSVNEQVQNIIDILKLNEDLMKVLDYIAKLNLPNFYIASGVIFQTVWNYYDEKPLNNGIKDIDIVYYDTENVSKEYEDMLENNIIKQFKDMNYEFDIHNEARMHLWQKANENKNIKYYRNSEEAINQWIATVQAVGITKEKESIKVYAPYGLSDIFSKTIRPIKHKYNSKDLYDRKIEKWASRFEDLNIIEWE